MLTMIKFFFWIAVIVFAGLFLLDYFGYEVNRNYFKDSQKECLMRLEMCKDEYVHQGLDNAECSFNCVDPKLIIEKKESE